MKELLKIFILPTFFVYFVFVFFFYLSFFEKKNARIIPVYYYLFIYLYIFHYFLFYMIIIPFLPFIHKKMIIKKLKFFFSSIYLLIILFICNVKRTG